MTLIKTKRRIEVPSNLCWPGKRDWIDEGSDVYVIEREDHRVLIMTLAGPFWVPADAVEKEAQHA